MVVVDSSPVRVVWLLLVHPQREWCGCCRFIPSESGVVVVDSSPVRVVWLL